MTAVWLGRSDCSRRDTRQRVKRLWSGPGGGGGDSPVRHRGPGYRHDCAQSRGSNQPPPSSSVRARTSRFSAATTRSEVPATRPSLRLGAPVSQRYRDVEDAVARPPHPWKHLRSARAEISSARSGWSHWSRVRSGNQQRRHSSRHRVRVVERNGVHLGERRCDRAAKRTVGREVPDHRDLRRNGRCLDAHPATA